MTKKSKNAQLMPLLKSSVNACFYNPIILVPFATTAFIQLLILEILYFAPRFPLSVFFGPVIRRFHGEAFLHYPYSFAMVPKAFQSVQIPIYIFISSFFIAVAVVIIAAVNNDQRITFGKACRQALSRYVHIIIAALISFGIFYGISSIYGLVIKRALQITSTRGIYFMIKSTVLYGAPYVNVLIGVFVTALFAFVFPVIMIEKKKVFAAIIGNFRALWGSCRFTFFVVAIPTLFYLPVMLLRTGIASPKMVVAFPGIQILTLVLSVLVMFAIDVVVYTAITTYYLLKKEN